MSEPSLPCLAPDDIDGERTPCDVYGVVLAAGTSTRYGPENKLLEPVDGEPLVRHAIRTLVASDADDVTVVVGHEADRVRAALDDFPVSFRENPDYGAGQSTSVREGVRAAMAAGVDAVVIALGDMPDVSPDTVDTLVECYERGAGTAVAPAYDGQRGNPVLFDARFFEALADVSGDVGGRQILLTGDDSVLIEVGDPGVVRDVDRPADLEE